MATVPQIWALEVLCIVEDRILSRATINASPTPTVQLWADNRLHDVRFTTGGREPLMALTISGMQQRVKYLTSVYSLNSNQDR